MINVSCNACHGDDSQHIKWAKGDSRITNKGYDVNIKMRTPVFHKNANGEMVSVQPLTQSQQVETCASCHARRIQLQDRTLPQDIVNAFTPSLLSSDLTYALAQEYSEMGQYFSALQYAKKLKQLVPNNPQVDAFIQQLKASVNR